VVWLEAEAPASEADVDPAVADQADCSFWVVPADDASVVESAVTVTFELAGAVLPERADSAIPLPSPMNAAALAASVARRAPSAGCGRRRGGRGTASRLWPP
jgi:hypothetical protein